MFLSMAFRIFQKALSSREIDDDRCDLIAVKVEHLGQCRDTYGRFDLHEQMTVFVEIRNIKDVGYDPSLTVYMFAETIRFLHGRDVSAESSRT